MKKFILLFAVFTFLFGNTASAQTSLISASIEQDDIHDIVLSLKDGQHERSIIIKEHYTGYGGVISGYTFNHYLLDFQGDLDSGYAIMDYIMSFHGPLHHIELLIYTKETVQIKRIELFQYNGWHPYLPNLMGELLYAEIQGNTIVTVLKSKGNSRDEENETKKITIARFAIQGNIVTEVFSYTVTEHDALLQEYLDIFQPNFIIELGEELLEMVDISTPESTFEVSATVKGLITTINLNLIDEVLKLKLDSSAKHVAAVISIIL